MAKFEASCSIGMLVSRFLDHFSRYSKFNSWPWTFTHTVFSDPAWACTMVWVPAGPAWGRLLGRSPGNYLTSLSFQILRCWVFWMWYSHREPHQPDLPIDLRGGKRMETLVIHHRTFFPQCFTLNCFNHIKMCFGEIFGRETYHKSMDRVLVYLFYKII